MTPFPRCSECGGTVVLSAGTGRTREIRRGVVVPIPDDFLIPTCTGCHECFMIPEVSEPLDRLLEEKLARPLHRQIEEEFHTVGGTSLDYAMWYNTPSPYLGGRTPDELYREGRGQEVLDMLRGAPK